MLFRSTRARRLAQRATNTLGVIQSGLDEQRRQRRELAAELAQAEALLLTTQQLQERDAQTIRELGERIRELTAALATARRGS